MNQSDAHARGGNAHGDGPPRDGFTNSVPSGDEMGGLVRIEAPSYREVFDEIRRRFGAADVNVVSTRTIRKSGVSGVFGAKSVEVYLTTRQAYESFMEDKLAKSRQVSGNPHAPRAPRPPQTSRPSIQQPPAPPAQVPPAQAPRAPEPRVPAQPTSSPPAPQPDAPEAPGGLDSHAISEKLRRLVNGVQDFVQEHRPEESPILECARVVLEKQGFSPEIIRSFQAVMRDRRLPDQFRDREEVEVLAQAQIRSLLEPRIPPCAPIPAPCGRGIPRVVSLVGPTGVGKTTTIAKLASHYHVIKQRKVGLVTLDTYRIGAVDQLQKYCDIIDLPLRVIESHESAKDGIESLRDRDVIFVDTAGRSQTDAEHLRGVRDRLDGITSLEVHLCVAATASRDSFRDVAENFREVPYNRLLITKLDEASRYGGLMDLFQAAQVPVSYMTTGQEVPQDIVPGTKELLLSRLLGE